MGLGDLLRRDVRSLSGGQRQRALLARALVRRPALFVLDEPTAGLDPPAQERLLQAIVDLHATERIAICFVTHDLELAARHATHVALFQGGQVVAGRREAVLDRAGLERTFGARAAAAAKEGRP